MAEQDCLWLPFCCVFQYGSKNRENSKRTSAHKNALDTFLVLFFYYFMEGY